MKPIYILPFVMFAAWIQTGCRPTGGEVSGKVTLSGTPPPAINIILDKASAKLRPNGLTTRHYLVAADGGLANVFVSIKAGLSNYNFTPATNPVVMELRGAQHEPYLLGVWTNQPVRFRNASPMMHNFHITPATSLMPQSTRQGNTLGPDTARPAPLLTGNREFNFAVLPPVTEPWYRAIYRHLFTRKRLPSATQERSFAAPESFIRVKCDVHPWEFGYICVTDQPFFAVTDANGEFRFPPHLPPGRYVIEARHLKAGAVTQEFVLGAGEKKRLELTLAVPAPKPTPPAKP